MVHCVKFDKDMPGLERVPWKGELGKRVYENVSAEAWKLWIEYSKMLMNEYRLNPLDPQSQKIMEEQMEQYFFGEGAKLPEGYVPPRAKGLSSTDFSLSEFCQILVEPCIQCMTKSKTGSTWLMTPTESVPVKSVLLKPSPSPDAAPAIVR